MKWEKVKLEDVCDVFAGSSAPQSKTHFSSDGLLFVRVSDLATKQNRLLNSTRDKINPKEVNNLRLVKAKAGTTIFPKSGAAILTNSRALLGVDMYIVSHLAALSPKENIEPTYIYFFMLGVDMKKYVPNVSYPSLNLKAIKKIKIAIPFKNGKPDLATQKRIVDRLDRFYSLQEKTESEISIADNLFESVCKKDFEKLKNSSDHKKIDDVCNVVKGQFPTLKTPKGKFTFVVTAEKRKSANDYQLNEEAVCIPLVSSTGHGHASLHRIHYEKGKFALANILVALIPKDKKRILTKYLYYYLSFYKNELLVSLMRGAANVTIPLYKINGVVVEIPKIIEQRRVISTLEKIEKLKHLLARNGVLSKQLFQSALNHAFQGKL